MKKSQSGEGPVANRPVSTDSGVYYNLRVPKGAKSHSSIGKQSSFTNYTDSVYQQSTQDNKSVNDIDSIPTVKPPITRMDELWTDIDVLDDVRHMSEEVRAKGSFFNKEFNDRLTKMKDLQIKLSDTLISRDMSSSTSDIFRIPNLENVTSADANHATKSELPKITEENVMQNFFEEKTIDPNNILFRKQNYDEVNKYIEDIKANLQELGEAMKQSDSGATDSWL